MSDRLRRAEAELYDLLGPELREITRIVSEPFSPTNQYRVELPVSKTIDLPIEELGSLVARTSNAFGRMARFAGMANAEYKIAKGRYERKSKQSRVGPNKEEREANAMSACEEEHLEMTVAEAVRDLANSLEDAARVASESARKLFDKAKDMRVAQIREEAGEYTERDFTP